jgi:hypothetical protein
MSPVVSLVSLDSSSFASAPAPSPASRGVAPVTSVSEPANRAAAHHAVRETVGVCHSAEDMTQPKKRTTRE